MSDEARTRPNMWRCRSKVERERGMRAELFGREGASKVRNDSNIAKGLSRSPRRHRYEAGKRSLAQISVTHYATVQRADGERKGYCFGIARRVRCGRVHESWCVLRRRVIGRENMPRLNCSSSVGRTAHQ